MVKMVWQMLNVWEPETVLGVADHFDDRLWLWPFRWPKQNVLFATLNKLFLHMTFIGGHFRIGHIVPEVSRTLLFFLRVHWCATPPRCTAQMTACSSTRWSRAERNPAGGPAGEGSGRELQPGGWGGLTDLHCRTPVDFCRKVSVTLRLSDWSFFC